MALWWNVICQCFLLLEPFLFVSQQVNRVLTHVWITIEGSGQGFLWLPEIKTCNNSSKSCCHIYQIWQTELAQVNNEKTNSWLAKALKIHEIPLSILGYAFIHNLRIVLSNFFNCNLSFCPLENCVIDSRHISFLRVCNSSSTEGRHCRHAEAFFVTGMNIVNFDWLTALRKSHSDIKDTL